VTEPKAYQLADAFHYLTRPEVDALIKIAQKLPPDPMVMNIGAGVGTSAMALLEAREDLTLVSLDIEGGISPLGGLGNELGALKEHEIDTQWRYAQITGDSIEIGLTWVRPLDLIVLDGEKTQMGRDLTTWWPHVKPGGYMAVHDYGSPMWWSVRRDIDDTLGNGGTLALLADTLAVFQREGP